MAWTKKCKMDASCKQVIDLLRPGINLVKAGSENLENYLPACVFSVNLNNSSQIDFFLVSERVCVRVFNTATIFYKKGKISVLLNESKPMKKDKVKACGVIRLFVVT